MMRTSRCACTAVLAAGAFLGLTATPALAASAPGPSGPRAGDLLGLGVRLGCPTCVDVDLLHAVRVHVHLGPGDCDEAAPPPAPRPPTPKPPLPKPPRPTPPPRRPPSSPQPPPRQAPPPPRPIARLAALPAPSRAAPHHATRPPTPPSASPSASPSLRPERRPLMPTAATPPARRKNPLTTLMVIVVITVVIAAGAGVAFAATP